NFAKGRQLRYVSHALVKVGFDIVIGPTLMMFEMWICYVAMRYQRNLDEIEMRWLQVVNYGSEIRFHELTGDEKDKRYEPFEAPKKVVRTRKIKKATSEVADVGEEETLTEGTTGGTLESEALASKAKPKPKTKPKKKVMISPGVGENIVGEEEGDDEGDKVEKAEAKGLRVQPRRRLRKAPSVLVAEVDSEETQSNKNV
ncbi:hypothetical protein Dimus_026839, partial [Dionaea muscipula]